MIVWTLTGLASIALTHQLTDIIAWARVELSMLLKNMLDSSAGLHTSIDLSAHHDNIALESDTNDCCVVNSPDKLSCVLQLYSMGPCGALHAP